MARLSRYARPGLAPGVACALITTDIPVDRDDSACFAIFDLLTAAVRYRAYDEETFAYSDRQRRFDPMSWRITTYRGPRDCFFPVPPFETDGQIPYPMHGDAFLRSREAYIVVDGLYDAVADMKGFR